MQRARYKKEKLQTDTSTISLVDCENSDDSFWAFTMRIQSLHQERLEYCNYKII